MGDRPFPGRQGGSQRSACIWQKNGVLCGGIAIALLEKVIWGADASTAFDAEISLGQVKCMDGYLTLRLT